MRTITYKEVLNAVSLRAGRSVASLSPQPTDILLITEAINSAYKFAWEHYDWPETMALEERIPVEQLIAWDQPNENVIGSITEIYSSDPTLPDANAPKVYWGQGSDGAWVKGTYTTVFVLFQNPVPKFSGSIYAGGTAYVVGNIIYDATTGQCYKALLASTGVAVTVTTTWQVVPMLALLREAVVAGAVAILRTDSGQDEKATVQQIAMQDALEHEVFLLDTRGNRKRRVRIG